MSFKVGERAGDYEIIQVLGAGGMGQVYKVRNVISDRVEAMKVLLPNLESDPELADRFLREIKVQASLVHPNIAALHTAQRVGNQLVMIMEFVEGQTLEKLLERGPIPAAQCADYIAQVLSALSYAHARGIVHRDIKPANMMLTTGGVVKLMDFGIAKMTVDRKLTQTGRTLGSLYYMSPEQIKGATEPDPRSDLYSLGISLYELMCGCRPFQGDSDFSIMAGHLQQTPVPPIQIDPSMPRAISDIILTAIAKDPAHRFQTADQFRTAMLNVGDSLAAQGNLATKPVATLPGTQPMAAALPPTNPLQPAYAQQPAGYPPPVPQPPPYAAYGAPPPPPAKSGGRAVYMVLGSLVTVAVLVLAVLQGPKLWKTLASGGSGTTATTQTNTNPPAGGQGIAGDPTAAGQSQSGNGQSAAQRSPGESTTGAQADGSTGQERPPQSGQGQGQSHGQRQTGREEGGLHGQQQGQVAPPEPATPVQPPPEPARPPGPDPAVQRALSEARDQYNEMAVRGSTAKSGVRSMEQQMARQGLNLRGDIKQLETRFDYLMQEAMSSIRMGDPVTAKKHLDSAELALQGLERFLGR